MKPHICLAIGAYLVISALETLGQQPKKCADYDQYCLVHSDCCSNSCLTYLYRCTRNYGAIYPYTLFGESYPATGTLENHSVQRNPRRRYKIPIDTQIDEGGIFIHIYKRAIVSNETQPITEAGEQPQNVSLNEDVSNEGDIRAEDTKTTSAVSDCKAIGSKCFNNDECCSKRCHGFLHQCVT